jgi:transposase
MVQTTLQENPFSDHVFVFRGRRDDLIKLLCGSCLVREKNRAWEIFLAAGDERNGGPDEAQLSMLLEGIDWRRPVRSYTPRLAV